jgi:hypothetical protein
MSPLAHPNPNRSVVDRLSCRELLFGITAAFLVKHVCLTRLGMPSVMRDLAYLGAEGIWSVRFQRTGFTQVEDIRQEDRSLSFCIWIWSCPLPGLSLLKRQRPKTYNYNYKQRSNYPSMLENLTFKTRQLTSRIHCIHAQAAKSYRLQPTTCTEPLRNAQNHRHSLEKPHPEFRKVSPHQLSSVRPRNLNCPGPFHRLQL